MLTPARLGPRGVMRHYVNLHRFLTSPSGRVFLALVAGAFLLSCAIGLTVYYSNSRWIGIAQLSLERGAETAAPIGREAAAIALGAWLILSVIGGGISAWHFRTVERANRILSELRRDMDRFRDFAELASDWCWETAPNHRFSYLSGQISRYGVDPNASLGLSRIDVAAEQAHDPNKWAAHVATLNRREAFKDFVYSATIGDQSRILAVTGKPVFGPDGEFRGYRGSTRDITSRIHAEERLVEAKLTAELANRSKSEFLANMSHELRTPLNAIIGFADIIAGEMLGPLGKSQYRDYAGDILVSGRHLLGLINSLLDLSRLGAEVVALREDEIDLAATIRDAARLITPRAADAGIAFDIDMPAGLPRMCADRTRISQIVTNLLSNAVKFTSAGGRIQLAATRLPDCSVAINVADTGIGMTEKQVAVALQPFGQVESSYARRGSGIGLGLALVKTLTELHQGTLTIQSNPGHGTRVRIVLPAERFAAAAGSALVADRFGADHLAELNLSSTSTR